MAGAASDWIQSIQSHTDCYLRCGRALAGINAALKDPQDQYPSTVLFLGNDDGEAARRALFPNHSRTASRGIAQLSVDPRTPDSKYPLYVASVSTGVAYTERKSARDHFGEPRHRVDWLPEQASASTTAILAKIVASRLLLRFVDVICLFIDDFNTYEEGLDMVRERFDIAPCIPQLIVITTHSLVDNLITLENPIEYITLTKRSGTSRPSSRYRKLKVAITQHIEAARALKYEQQVLFSALHFRSFFQSAVQHISKHGTADFDFIRATRSLHAVDSGHSGHLQNFLRLCAPNGIAKDVIIDYIASSFAMDSLPPGMHAFKPMDLFERLYQEVCEDAFSLGEFLDLNLGEWCQSLIKRYEQHCLEIGSSMMSSSELHRRTIEQSRLDFQAFCSSVTCLVCLRRRPEHSLPCGHSCCDTCVRIYGTQNAEVEHSYYINACILCQTKKRVKITLKPPTAGSRLLVLDGGGVRGAFTLQALQALEIQRKLPYPIYDEFDLVLGTSTGGLIALMFLLRRNLHECILTFRKLATVVFAKQERRSTSLISRIGSMFSSIVRDSLYGEQEMEKCVQEAYGTNTLLFGSHASMPAESRLKVAVTTMAVSNSKLCILSNYNGTGVRRGYKHYRPPDAKDEVRIRDAARATSAAPSYFPPKYICGLGSLQDGGAGKFNNPVAPAEWESRAIWNNSPDLVVSIGTGYSEDPATPKVVARRSRLKESISNHFFLRVWRLFSAVIDAQGSWQDHWNQIKEHERHKYFRINMTLDEETALDDINKMPQLERQAKEHLATQDFSAVIQAFFASAFFFQLRKAPVMKGKSYACQGIICSRSPDPEALVDRILDENPDACFVTSDGVVLGTFKQTEICISCGRFRKLVEIRVKDLQEDITIYLRLNRLRQRKISGFPTTIMRLATLQNLDAAFGTPDHRVIRGDNDCTCATSKKRSRAVSLTTKVVKRRRFTASGTIS